MFNLKPSIKDYSPAAGRSSESPVTYEMRINYFWEFSTLTTVCFQRTETGSIFSVDAWPVKTRSTWIVQNSGPGECNLMEDFEILSAPWGMWWFVLWVAGKQHRDLVEMVARKAMDADLGGAEGPEL